MATELLERTAIQMFNDDSMIFQTPRDDLVWICLPLEDAMLDTLVIDHENGLLTIRVQDLVRFSPDQETYATAMCNILNNRGFGKFLLDEYRDLSYDLDFPTTEATGPSEFKVAMICAISSVTEFYPVIMTVRWGNTTIEQALERHEIES